MSDFLLLHHYRHFNVHMAFQYAYVAATGKFEGTSIKKCCVRKHHKRKISVSVNLLYNLCHITLQIKGSN